MQTKIKRTTRNGIKTCTGEIFVANGYQYCISKFDGYLNAIELQTGFRVRKVELQSYRVGSPRSYLKNAVREIPAEKMRTAIKLAQKWMILHKIPFPLNGEIKADMNQK